MVVREFLINGASVRLNYAPELYRRVAELAGQTVNAKTIVAVVRANPHIFSNGVRLELVREDLRTLRFVPVVSALWLVLEGWTIGIRQVHKCDKCGNFYRTKEEALACAASLSKTKTPVTNKK